MSGRRHCCIERSDDRATGNPPVRHLRSGSKSTRWLLTHPRGLDLRPFGGARAKILRQRCSGMAQCNSAPQRGPALPETATLRHGLPPARRRRQADCRAGGCGGSGRRRGGSGRALGGVTHIQRGRPARPRSSALRISHNPNPQHRRYPPDGDPAHPLRPRLPSPRVGAPEPSRWSALPDERLDGNKHRRTLNGAENASLTQRGTGMTRQRLGQ
jgi:hypothetical protein